MRRLNDDIREQERDDDDAYQSLLMLTILAPAEPAHNVSNTPHHAAPLLAAGRGGSSGHWSAYCGNSTRSIGIMTPLAARMSMPLPLTGMALAISRTL